MRKGEHSPCRGYHVHQLLPRLVDRIKEKEVKMGIMDGLNIDRMLQIMSEILSDRHGVQVTMTVKEKGETNVPD